MFKAKTITLYGRKYFKRIENEAGNLEFMMVEEENEATTYRFEGDLKNDLKLSGLKNLSGLVIYNEK